MSLRLHSGIDGTEAGARVGKGRADNPDEVKAGKEPAEKVAADEPASHAETLEYIMTLTVQIKKMAQRAGFQRLGLILMLAEQEARQQMVSQSSRTPGSQG